MALAGFAMSTTIFISAGEASGEHYGALLVTALKQRLAASGQTARFLGMGGERMAAAGLERVVRSEDMAVMGISEVLRHLPRIYGEYRKLKKAIRTERPNVAVLIDFPDVNFALAEELHRLKIPVIFFVSPQLWAWKQHRIKLVQKYVSKMLVIFPFEEAFYRERGVEAEFVGHPLADLMQPSVSRDEFAKANRLDPSKAWIGLLPGSRVKEIGANLPEMLESAWTLSGYPRDPAKRTYAGPERRVAAPGTPSPFRRRRSDQFEFLIPLAPTLDAAQRLEVAELADARGGGISVHVVDDARGTLWHARASIVASGTATVEAALIGNPFVVVYRVSALTYAVAKRAVKVPHVAMANLIAGKRVVPELIQHDFTAANIVQEIEKLLPDGDARESMKMGLRTVREKLGLRTVRRREEDRGAIERVATITLEQLGF